MPKNKYKYNPKTLNYDRIEHTLKDRLLIGLKYLIAGSFIACIFLFISFYAIPSPKEIRLKNENAYLQSGLTIANEKMTEMESVLKGIQKRDDYVYRTIFEAEPIPDNLRKAGIGGAEKFKEYKGYPSSKDMIDLQKSLDSLSRQLVVQSKSFDEVVALANNKEQLLKAIPAIQPVANKDLTRMASGYGWRIHPIYKVRKKHTGMDFTAKTGTEIYATGDGKIVEVITKRRGYGKHIKIDHGFGYKTLYAHMSKFNVRKGQKVKRGDVIGYIGSTGTSTAPHLHYEVVKNNIKVNPINYFFNDLSEEQYEEMIEMSSGANQSFD